MKTIKLIVVALLPVFMGVASFAQGTVEITTSKQTFVQSETGSVTQFTYTGTATEVTALQEKAVRLKVRLSLEMTKNANGSYACKLIITQQNHAEYAVKMFLSLGIEKVTVDGAEKPVDELATDLNAMK